MYPKRVSNKIYISALFFQSTKTATTTIVDDTLKVWHDRRRLVVVVVVKLLLMEYIRCQEATANRQRQISFRFHRNVYRKRKSFSPLLCQQTSTEVIRIWRNCVGRVSGWVVAVAVVVVDQQQFEQVCHNVGCSVEQLPQLDSKETNEKNHSKTNSLNAENICLFIFLVKVIRFVNTSPPAENAGWDI